MTNFNCTRINDLRFQGQKAVQAHAQQANPQAISQAVATHAAPLAMSHNANNNNQGGNNHRQGSSSQRNNLLNAKDTARFGAQKPESVLRADAVNPVGEAHHAINRLINDTFHPTDSNSVQPAALNRSLAQHIGVEKANSLNLMA